MQRVVPHVVLVPVLVGIMALITAAPANLASSLNALVPLLVISVLLALSNLQLVNLSVTCVLVAHSLLVPVVLNV